MKRNYVLHWVLAFVVTAGLAVFIYACSGGGSGSGGSSTIHLSGTIASSGTGTGYTIAMSKSQLFYAKAMSILGLGSLAYATGTDPTVDKVVAIPMDRGSLNAWSMQNSIQQTISNSDGSFSLSLPQTTDWLLVLINSSETGTNRFVGSLALNTATSDSLLNLPATDATISSLDLGTLSRPTASTTDAISSATVTATNFNMTADQLTAMAKSDDLFRNAMNIVNNYGNTAFENAATEWYQLRPDFAWLDSTMTLDTAYSHPNNMTYQGMNFQLDSNTTNVNMASICTNTGIVALHPPTLVTMGAKTFDYANPIKNSGAGCVDWNGGPAQETTNSDLYACNGYEGKISYSVLASFTSGTIPGGFWEWKENNVTKAAFEVGNVNPPVTGSGKARGFVPSYKINLEAVTNKILSVDVQWYYYDETAGNYVPVIDKSVLKHFIQGAEVKFDVGMGSNRKTCEMYFDPATTSNVNPASYSSTLNCGLAWYYGNSGQSETNTGLMGFYESGGFGYFFHYSPKP